MYRARDSRLKRDIAIKVLPRPPLPILSAVPEMEADGGRLPVSRRGRAMRSALCMRAFIQIRAYGVSRIEFLHRPGSFVLA